MSVTTSDNPVTTTIDRAVLQDYDIHLTGDDGTVAPPNTDNQPPPASNPPDWAAEHRGVPPYRPINTRLDRSQRPWGINPVASAFIFTMMHGVWLNAVLADCDKRLVLIRYGTEYSLGMEEYGREDK
ncbi:hypothetical protein VPNG_02675 [Cytospora leucostoma]|uniref:Uncharacterized protein n=1 Tax=Cytospora leucostoma TaxID=1230097 RepID=A0A423XIK5_9PEZI|nr:hypothetical protein VPNG_02675 [Cytospora leucostoma]